MTREQAINYLFSCGFTNEQVGEVVRALTYEPTTKNNLGVDCISRQGAIDAIRRIHPIDTDYDCTLFDKVDVMYVLNDIPSVTPQLSSELEKNSKKLEKDFGESDYIRRSDIGLTDFEIVMCNGDYKEALKMLLDKIEKASPVTPQEPIIKALGEELRKAREGIADEKVLIGYNMAVAICNKHLGGSEVDNGNDD